MNHIYKIVRNRTGKLVVTGENASSHVGVSEKHPMLKIGQCVVLLCNGIAMQWYCYEPKLCHCL